MLTNQELEVVVQVDVKVGYHSHYSLRLLLVDYLIMNLLVLSPIHFWEWKVMPQTVALDSHVLSSVVEAHDL